MTQIFYMISGVYAILAVAYYIAGRTNMAIFWLGFSLLWAFLGHLRK